MPGRRSARRLPGSRISERHQEGVERLGADRPEDDPGDEADGQGDERHHRRGRLQGEGGGQALRRPRGRPSAPASPAARTTRLPTITPSASSPTARACSPVEMPKPTATGHLCRRADALDQLAQAGRQLAALAGGAGERDRVDEAARVAADLGEPLVGRGRRDERDQRQAGGVAGRAHGRPPPRAGRSGTISPAAPAVGAPRRANRSPPCDEHDVRVDHQQHRDALGDLLAEREHVARLDAGVERIGAGRVDHRAVGQRVGERDARARSGRRRPRSRPQARARGLEVRDGRPSGTASAPPACP